MVDKEFFKPQNNSRKIKETFEDIYKKIEKKDNRIKDFYNILKTYTKKGKMITDKELNKVAEGFGL